jgi:hypothetical protein
MVDADLARPDIGERVHALYQLRRAGRLDAHEFKMAIQELSLPELRQLDALISHEIRSIPTRHWSHG